MQVERHEVANRIDKVIKMVIDNCDDEHDKEELMRLNNLLISTIMNMDKDKDHRSHLIDTMEYHYGAPINLC